jgi:hypothetical protein
MIFEEMGYSAEAVRGPKSLMGLGSSAALLSEKTHPRSAP